jgi:hypothetical protein
MKLAETKPSALTSQTEPDVFGNEEILMARVTVEDCLENISSRFELVILASKRANNS